MMLSETALGPEGRPKSAAGSRIVCAVVIRCRASAIACSSRVLRADCGIVRHRAPHAGRWRRDSLSARDAATCLALRYTGRLEAAPARSPLFCRDLLHVLDFEIAVGDEPLEPRVLLAQPLKLCELRGFHAPEAFAPVVQRLLRDAVLVGRCRRAFGPGLLHDADDLFLGETGLLYCLHG